jgi:hypothetical protein
MEKAKNDVHIPTDEEFKHMTFCGTLTLDSETGQIMLPRIHKRSVRHINSDVLKTMSRDER